MTVSTEAASFAAESSSALDSEFAHDDPVETAAPGEAEDYHLIATRRAQLEDADTLRRMRAL
jgi:hypothetical protein